MLEINGIISTKFEWYIMLEVIFKYKLLKKIFHEIELFV